MKFLAVLILNVLYCLILFHDSEISDIAPDQVIEYYTQNISADTGSYLIDSPKRTIGYSIILKLFMQFDNFLVWILMFNCLLGAWLFYVVHQLIGWKAWILAGLGAFTAHVPILYTDLLFAAVFVTSIWQVKRLWLHFLLLGIASVIRPSLAWFFLIEPFVLYFNGYNKKTSLMALPIVFILTSFNPIRNLVNHGIWTHSTVLKYNMESGNYYDNPTYFVKSFKANYLSGHYDYIGAMWNKYKRDMGDKVKSNLMFYLNICCVLINFMIWIRFIIRVLQSKVNYGYVVMAAYFIGPTLFGAAGSRLRLPIEWILLI